MTPAALRIRYPVVAAATDEAAQYWIDDAARYVDASWGLDQAPGVLAYAAHNLLLSGVLAGDDVADAGVTSFRSGSFSLTVSEEAANRAARGGYSATEPGRQFAALLRRHVGGPRLVGC